jgi:hypothetical protein
VAHLSLWMSRWSFNCYHNTFVAYRILFIVPTIVASAKRSFSKLKSLKNYLRSSLVKEGWSGNFMHREAIG